MTDQHWYIVVGFGARDGSPKRDPDEAWDSFYRLNRVWNHPESQGSFRARTSAHLYAATTKLAASQADISETQGRIKRGEWWRA